MYTRLIKTHYEHQVLMKYLELYTQYDVDEQLLCFMHYAIPF
jgi:hypothetical protein